jgi:hypothetical protein
MKRPSYYTLSKSSHHRLLKTINNNYCNRKSQRLIKKLICFRCERELVVGDEITTKSNRYGIAKVYHHSCFEDMFLEC